MKTNAERLPVGQKQRMVCAVVAVILTFCMAGCALAQSPDKASVEAALAAAHAKYKGLQEGKNADYIPALAQAHPDLFGVCVADVESGLRIAGDATTEFSLVPTRGTCVDP